MKELKVTGCRRYLALRKYLSARKVTQKVLLYVKFSFVKLNLASSFTDEIPSSDRLGHDQIKV